LCYLLWETLSPIEEGFSHDMWESRVSLLPRSWRCNFGAALARREFVLNGTSSDLAVLDRAGGFQSLVDHLIIFIFSHVRIETCPN